MRTLRSLSLVSLFKKGLLVETWGYHQRESQGCASKQEVKAATPRSSAAEGRREGQGCRRPWGLSASQGPDSRSAWTTGGRGPSRQKQVWAEPGPGKAGIGRRGVVPCGPWQSLKQCSHLSEVSPPHPTGHSTGSEGKTNQVYGELPCGLSHNNGTKLPAASGLGLLWVSRAK